MKEYLIKLRVSTAWHEPHNTTTHNDYTEVVEASSASKAVSKCLSSWSNTLNHPNKDIDIKSVKLIG